MATLNIKNLPDDLYGRLKATAEREHRSVSRQATHILAEALTKPEPLSIRELRGLGKHHWDRVDPSEFVDEERRSWD